jgi:hypothetical protein
LALSPTSSRTRSICVTSSTKSPDESIRPIAARARDLCLACGCAAGQPVALEAFERVLEGARGSGLPIAGEQRSSARIAQARAKRVERDLEIRPRGERLVE